MLLFLLLLLLPLCGAVEVKRPRGVSLTNHHFYDESRPFTCLDGSATVPFDQVNDDYCDCKDGSDEPGTAACANGNFHCTNTGYKPLYISSSWVNDGVCDCCDGTDEYNSGIICENTCKEKGRKERETLQHLAEVTREGFRLKKILIEEWKKSREEKEIKLVELQEQKKLLVDQVDTLRATKEEAEKPEKEAKEEHRKLWEEQLARAQREQEQARVSLIFQELDDNMDEWVSVTELQTHPELDTDGDGVLSEEEAQALLSGDSRVDNAAFLDRVWANIKDKYQTEALPPDLQPAEPEQQKLPQVPPEEEEEEEEEQEEEEEEEAEEEEEPEEAQMPGEQPPQEAPPPAASPAREDPTSQMPPYDDNTQSLIDAAQKARSEFEEAERSLKDMQETIRNLEQEISFDFGPSGEFSYLYSQCYELATNEYVYRLCPFKLVSQKPKHGGSPTSLGTWGSWAGPEHDKYSAMKYEQGTGCWQGPNRSTTVRLLCGKETVVTSTTEPSRCEYLMELTTPAACPEVPPELPGDDHDEL